MRTAIERINASAIITSARVEDMLLAEKARLAAARAMSIRCIAGFWPEPAGWCGSARWLE